MLNNLFASSSVTLKYGQVTPVVIDWKDAEGKTINDLLNIYGDRLAVDSTSNNLVVTFKPNDKATPVLTLLNTEVSKGGIYTFFCSLEQKR